MKKKSAKPAKKAAAKKPAAKKKAVAKKPAAKKKKKYGAMDGPHGNGVSSR